MKQKYYCVIMAGGIGSRFWPYSRTKKPKQFLDILGVGKTLLQQTFDRFSSIIPAENMYIVSNREYKELIKEQLKDLPDENILLEPMRRNTAPCIDYANFRILKKDPDAKIVVAPSDHLILKEDLFIECIKAGLDFVGKNEALLTLGISPNRPETGYGYIQSYQKKVSGYENLNLRKVKTFTEKPDLEMAKVFLKSGDFNWNAGIFFWSLNTIMNSFEKHLSEIHDMFREGEKLFGTKKEAAFVEKTYSSCTNISIDYGIMEKADNVYVLVADFGWSDLGTWGSLYEQMDKDDKQNSITGKNVFLYETNGSIVKVPDDKLVVLQGLKDYIIVQTESILLICKKKDEQKIKQFVNDIRAESGDEMI